MNYIVKDIEYTSSNKVDIVHARIFVPKDVEKIKGIIQISHGMCEHFGKYKDFMEFLANSNFIVCMNNHLGHGEYVAAENRGFFSDENGYENLVDDVYKLSELVKEKYSSTNNLPYFLFGHSMGSFIARCYMYKYGDKINGYIIAGTGGPNPLVDTGIKLANMIIAKKGKMYRSRMLTDIVIGKFNEKFKPNASKYDWLSSNESMLPVYLKDKLGDFVFTASGYKDLFYLQKNSNMIDNIKKVPQDLPIFILSGDMDPVGDFGEGVLKVYHNFIKTGHTNVTVKLYPNYRHELLNEVNKTKVYNDILDWIISKI